MNQPQGSQTPYGELFEEITDLLAEALLKDFQAHRRATVNSPRGNDHKNLLTGGSIEGNPSTSTELVRARLSNLPPQ